MKNITMAIAALDAIEITATKGNQNQITPSGYFRAIDGRPSEKGLEKGWYIDATLANDLIKHISEKKTEIVVDHNHASLQTGHPAPAAGWVKKLEWNDEGLFANVEWTPKATEGIEKKEFRYISPVIIYSPDTGEIKGIHSISLTNVPALDGMKEATLTHLLKEDHQVETKLPNEINELLGLSPDSSDSVTALKKLIERLENAEKQSAELTNLLGTPNHLEGIAALKQTKPQQDIKHELFAEQVQTIAQLKVQVENLNQERIDDKFDALINAALEQGKFTNFGGKEGNAYNIVMGLKEAGDMDGYLKFVKVLTDGMTTPPAKSQTANMPSVGNPRVSNYSGNVSMASQNEDAEVKKIAAEQKISYENAAMALAKMQQQGG